ncbi:MAG: transporter, family, alpha-ketoglutarate permease [Methylobacteriaceae bacterium]|jgi:MHS family alpha-ketoglutarate permease-like MFS transporter|nr:transporter, family, alpha-ketoglutarate permease [Methylobacteriaceae bacterium]
MTTIVQAGPMVDAHDKRRRIFAIIGASSGNLVEWYDFYTYAFTAIYFASAFFPSGNQTTQLLNTAGVFAAGFLMRPIGGYIFGWVADKYGRRTSMMISVLMMCFGSLMIACLPTYASIGLAAPALLLLARLLQGLSVGGEYGTSATYMSEVAIGGQRGFYASFQYVTLIGGQLLAVLVLVIIQQFMPEAEIKAWGWRIPFFVGAATAVVALYLRASLDETSSVETRQRKEAGSLAAIFRHHTRAFVTVLGFTAGGSLIFYTFTTYMQKYLVNTAGMDTKTASRLMTIVLLVYMAMQPLFGALSDKIGRKTSMILFGGLATLATMPLLSALSGVKDTTVAFLLITAALAIVSFYTSISGLVKAELFPAEVRALSVGLSYAIANAIFGGSAEAVALYFKSVGHETWFFWYVTVMVGISFIFALTMPDSRRKGYLQGHGTE